MAIGRSLARATRERLDCAERARPTPEGPCCTEGPVLHRRARAAPKGPCYTGGPVLHRRARATPEGPCYTEGTVSYGSADSEHASLRPAQRRHVGGRPHRRTRPGTAGALRPRGSRPGGRGAGRV